MYSSLILCFTYRTDWLLIVIWEMAAEEANNNGGGISTVHHKFPAVANPMAEKPSEIASNISYHALFSPHFSPFKFEPEQAYYATAESVRDRLIQVPFLITTIQFTQTSPLRFLLFLNSVPRLVKMSLSTPSVHICLQTTVA